MAEQVCRDELAAEAVGKRITLIDDASNRDMAAAEIAMWDVIEIAVSVGIAQPAVLVKLLPVVGALHAVDCDVTADIGAVKQLPMFVKIKSPAIAAALAEQFETMGERMIAPNSLLKLDAR